MSQCVFSKQPLGAIYTWAGKWLSLACVSHVPSQMIHNSSITVALVGTLMKGLVLMTDGYVCYNFAYILSLCTHFILSLYIWALLMQKLDRTRTIPNTNIRAEINGGSFTLSTPVHLEGWILECHWKWMEKELSDTCKSPLTIDDCCCDYKSIDYVNVIYLHPVLQELVKRPFFRYFRVKLAYDCPFWPDDYLCQEGKSEATVDLTLDANSFKEWVEIDNPWTHDDESDNGEMMYVNLLLNPEGYTGYSGPSTRRIWDAIYSENCPRYAYGETCKENKVLYKLVSGLHSSISVHAANSIRFMLLQLQWGPNFMLMHDRVLKHPDRVENLYFTFLFVLRSVIKAAAYLDQVDYESGNEADDLAQWMIKHLVWISKLHVVCALPFDEAEIWKGHGGSILRKQIQDQFRNISALMDCVGCEKCRLWGKLQVLGLGTALKILFSVDNQGNQDPQLILQRNEVIALINLLHQLSESIVYVYEMRDKVEEPSKVARSSISGEERRIDD
ncbi:endoplasmic reticulum oxidoreductin-1-like [Rutidosis leptorrhynchoides]|uniref:endoplasmic reticulum oxidoreductin-1-like n=1 Tax=Rutidosis leptorrhynchoides TaxID=125765 RepID=UPI003A9916E9